MAFDAFAPVFPFFTSQYFLLSFRKYGMFFALPILSQFFSTHLVKASGTSVCFPLNLNDDVSCPFSIRLQYSSSSFSLARIETA